MKLQFHFRGVNVTLLARKRRVEKQLQSKEQGFKYVRKDRRPIYKKQIHKFRVALNNILKQL